MNEQNDGNKVKGWIGKHIKVLALILLVLSASGYYVYKGSTELGLSKPILIITVATGLTQTGSPAITNATFEQSGAPFFYKATDSIPNFPEIDANVRINRLESVPASYWASVSYKGEGKYTLKIFFKDNNKPKSGDILIIPIRIVTHTGAIAYKTTAFWVWE